MLINAVRRKIKNQVKLYSLCPTKNVPLTFTRISMSLFSHWIVFWNQFLSEECTITCLYDDFSNKYIYTDTYEQQYAHSHILLLRVHSQTCLYTIDLHFQVPNHSLESPTSNKSDINTSGRKYLGVKYGSNSSIFLFRYMIDTKGNHA